MAITRGQFHAAEFRPPPRRNRYFWLEQAEAHAASRAESPYRRRSKYTSRNLNFRDSSRTVLSAACAESSIQRKKQPLNSVQRLFDFIKRSGSVLVRLADGAGRHIRERAGLCQVAINSKAPAPLRDPQR